MKTRMRTYERTWGDIEEMLNEAVQTRREWEMHFERCRKRGHRQGQKTAVRNVKALEGVIKTLRWVLGEEGVEHPLE
jgi:hypothetical protein